MVRRSALFRLLGLAGVLCGVAASLVLAQVTASDEPAEIQTLTLQPGDNFVGWVAETSAVTEIFEQIPEAVLIYRWDAADRKWQHTIREVGGNLETLEPGMAAKIRIDGRRSVKWERPLTPAKGGITLYSGVNWVAWGGRDEWPLDQVARGIGTSLIGIEVEERGIVYQPGDDHAEAIAPLQGYSAIRRGDALRVTVNRDLRWLQPTGMMPKIVWVGEISESLKAEIMAGVQHVLDFFAEQLAVETDYADTTILIWNGVDAAVEHEESLSEPRFGYPPDVLRTRLAAGWLAAARPWGFYVSACGWQSPSPPPCHGRTTETLIHEWFHHAQGLLTGPRDERVTPVWMIEGPAIWAEWQLPSELRNHPYQADRQWRLDNVARMKATLQIAEQPYTDLAYQLGALASERLAEQGGTDAHLEYYRLLFPQRIGEERQWVRRSTWHEAFAAAFGLSTAEFYERFAAWRATLPTPEQRYDYYQNDVTLSGTLHHDDGSPASSYRVEATTFSEGVKISLARTAIVDETGGFAIEVTPDSMQRLEFTRDGCRLWLSDAGLVTLRPQTDEHLELDTRRLSPLNLSIPEGACENELRVSVTRLGDDYRARQVLLIDPETGAWTRTEFIGNGTFTGYAPEPGEFLLRLRLDDCGVYWTNRRMVASRREADVLHLAEDPVSIRFRVPDSLCVHRISGRVVKEDGTGVSGVWLSAWGDHAESGVQTAADGSFSVTVPDSRDYTLSIAAEAFGCRIRFRLSAATSDWHEATPITVSDEDVTGIEFVVPNDPADLCR